MDSTARRNADCSSSERPCCPSAHARCGKQGLADRLRAALGPGVALKLTVRTKTPPAGSFVGASAAERDATVGKIHAKEGDSLAVDAVILEFA